MASRESNPSEPTSPPSAACVVCHAQAEEGRCPDCGAAIAPGGYRIVKLLAQTPHSRLYLAEDASGQTIALKELLFALVPDMTQLDAFEREATLLRQLDHPQIPRFVRSFREGGGVNIRLYLAQQYVQGVSLLVRLAEHRFDEAEVRDVARQVLEILRYLHGLSPRVLHRDIKPANIMRRPDGSMVLVDFGSARDLVQGATHGSTLVGTYGYMPPEQLGGTVDCTSDLYALGASLVHLLTRREPSDLMRDGMRLEFADRINVTAPTREFLKRLVEPRIDRRFPSAEDALQALDALELAPHHAVSLARSRKLVAAGLAAATGLAVVAGMALMRPSAPAVRPAAPKPPAQPAPPRVDIPLPKRAVPPAASSVSGSGSPKGFDYVVLERAPKVPEEFALTGDFTIPLDLKVQTWFGKGKGKPCGPKESELELTRLDLAAGESASQEPTLYLAAAFHNNGQDPVCQGTRIALLDGNGQAFRSSYGNISSLKPMTTKELRLAYYIPRSTKAATLVIGDQEYPEARYQLDLQARTVTAMAAP